MNLESSFMSINCIMVVAELDMSYNTERPAQSAGQPGEGAPQYTEVPAGCAAMEGAVFN